VQILIVYPKLPASSNRLYFKGTRLTAEARAYAEAFSYYVVREYLPQISQLNRKGVYALHLRFYMSNLVNDSYFATKGKRAETPYKRVDLSNRIKLIEDCIRDAISIDDCQTFAASQEKYQVPEGQERVEILVQEIEPTQFGVPPWT
jgi:Holliday junction resolvase RusA-like endonuclease